MIAAAADGVPSAYRAGTVLAVKRGEVGAAADVLTEIDAIQARIRDLLATGRTPLPAEPDWDATTDWSVDAHRRHWNWT